MGYSKEQVISAFENESNRHPNKDVSSLWPAVLCHLREEQVYGSLPESQIMMSASNVVNGISSSSLIQCFFNVTDEYYISVYHFTNDQVPKSPLEKRTELRVHPLVGMWQTYVLLIFQLFL